MSWWPSAGGASLGLGLDPLPRGLAAADRARRRLRPPGCWSLRPARRRTRRRPRSSTDQIVLFGAGLAVLWAALDWPLGALAAGYLASANALQDLLITLGAAPLLLLGLPRGRPRPEQQAPRDLREHALGQRLRRALGSPLVGGATFGIALAVTHLPAVVDALRPSPWGSFAITAAWLAAAVGRSGRRWSARSPGGTARPTWWGCSTSSRRSSSRRWSGPSTSSARTRSTMSTRARRASGPT